MPSTSDQTTAKIAAQKAATDEATAVRLEAAARTADQAAAKARTTANASKAASDAAAAKLKPAPAPPAPPPVAVKPPVATPTPTPPVVPVSPPVVTTGSPAGNQPAGPSPVTVSPPNQIDLENLSPTFSWDFRKQGLGLQKDGGPWRTSWHFDFQSNDPSVTGWVRRIQSTDAFPKAGDVLQFYVDDGLIPWSPFSFNGDGDLVITARRTDPAWLPKLWGWQGGWVGGMLNTGPQVAEGQFWGPGIPSVFAQRFGYFECDLMMDNIFSNWGAFWAVPAQSDNAQELDIVERVAGQWTFPICSVHGGAPPFQSVVPASPLQAGDKEFVTFGAEWTTDGKVQAYCNRVAYGVPMDVSARNWVAPIFLILSMNVGAGGWASNGPPAAATQSMSATFRNPRAYSRVKARA